MIKNTVTVVVPSETKHSNYNWLKCTPILSLSLLRGYVSLENVSLAKSSCSGRLVDFWYPVVQRRP